MTITIKFNDNIKHEYNSFDQITQLDNYDEIIYINWHNNKLSSLPQLPNSLEILHCFNNNLSSLPKLPNSLKILYCYNDPIYNYIAKYFNNDWEKYREFQHKIHNMTMKVFANKIGEWYLECKYNPEYKYCKDRINKEYEEAFINLAAPNFKTLTKN